MVQRPLDAVLLIAAQVGLAAGISVPALLVVGACAGWVPLIGTLLAPFALVLWWGWRRPGWLSRARVRRLASLSGVAHAPLVAGVYAAAWLALPDAFAFEASALALLAPVLGLGGGVVAAALTLCAGDAAATVIGVDLGERRPVPPAGGRRR